MIPKRLKCRECEFRAESWGGPYGLIRHFRGQHAVKRDPAEEFLDLIETEQLEDEYLKVQQGWADTTA